MTDNELEKKADQLFWHYERDKFEYSGQYCYDTELVFHFADYVESLSDSELSDFLGKGSCTLPEEFRRIVRQGIDQWLQYNAKTMLIM